MSFLIKHELSTVSICKICISIVVIQIHVPDVLHTPPLGRNN